MRSKLIARALLLTVALVGVSAARADVLKPFILADAPTGDFDQTVESVKTALSGQGFDLVGTYAALPGATVVCVTDAELKAAAAKVKNGGFGAAERVGITEVNGKIQVSYVNPAYMGVAYGMGKLDGVAARLKAALGAQQDFGSVGIKEEDLKPGSYHYAMMMPYFYDVDVLKEYPDHQSAVDAVEKNLAAGEGGTVKVYRVDLPGRDVSVFGVGLVKGVIDGPDKGDKDTDKEILAVVDFQELRHTAYLPYELMVDGKKVIALRARYRIALYFPDTRMTGSHGFTNIMSAPWSIQVTLERVAGFKRNI